MQPRATLLLLTLTLLIVPPSLAGTAASGDCVPAATCTMRISNGEIASSAWHFLGLRPNRQWIARNRVAMEELFQPYCIEQARCFTVPGNTFMFCGDRLLRAVAGTCDSKFSRTTEPDEWEQCQMFARVWAVLVDQQAPRFWKPAQACAVESLKGTGKKRRMRVEVSDTAIPYGHDIEWHVSAWDSESGLPVEAAVDIEGQGGIVSDAPTAKPASFYPIRFQLRPIREIGADGRDRTRAPAITVRAEHYETERIILESPVPQLEVSIEYRGKLRSGSSTVIVRAADRDSGRKLEGQVLRGDRVIGTLDVPVPIEVSDAEVAAGCPHDLWVRVHRYADAPVPCG